MLSTLSHSRLVQLGLATLVFVAAVSAYAMLLVVQCKYKLREQGRFVTTYGEIGHIAVGRVGGLLVDCLLVISQSSFCIACAYRSDPDTRAKANVGVDSTLSPSLSLTYTLTSLCLRRAAPHLQT